MLCGPCDISVTGIKCGDGSPRLFEQPEDRGGADAEPRSHATSTSATEVAGLAAVSLSLGLYLATGQRLYCTVGTAQSAGTDVCAVVGRSHADFNV